MKKLILKILSLFCDDKEYIKQAEEFMDDLILINKIK